MPKQWRFVMFVGALLILTIAGRPAMAQGLSIAEHLGTLAAMSREGMDAASRNDSAAMQHEYNEIHEAWELFEDDVRDANPSLYLELEAALTDVKDAIAGEVPDAAAAGAAFDHLFDELSLATTSFQSGEVGEASKPSTVQGVLDKLDASIAALQQSAAQEGSEHLQLVAQAWPSIEGAIAAKSQSDYHTVESELGKAIGALKATPADLVSAETSIAKIRAILAPYADQQSYSMFDAAAVILREGLEALLVVVALLALLQRSGNQDKQRWVWVGVSLGVLASIATGFVLQIIFSRVTAGQNRELIEGITGIVAAALLLYVSYWLHSKSSLASWQKYIHTQTSQVLARGSMFGLATLAFLTVFREGAETTIFYMGMAPSISSNDLLLGLALGVAVLLVAAILMLVMGVRLPIRLFFQLAGILVYYLGFKFLGLGVHALQVAGAMSNTPVSFMPEIPSLGIYPTWETLIPQILLLVIAISVVWYMRANDQKVLAPPATTASGA